MIILGYLSIFHFLDLMDRKYVNNFLQINFRKAQHGTAWLTTRNGASLKRPGRSLKHQTFDQRMTLSTFPKLAKSRPGPIKPRTLSTRNLMMLLLLACVANGGPNYSCQWKQQKFNDDVLQGLIPASQQDGLKCRRGRLDLTSKNGEQFRKWKTAEQTYLYIYIYYNICLLAKNMKNTIIIYHQLVDETIMINK